MFNPDDQPIETPEEERPKEAAQPEEAAPEVDPAPETVAEEQPQDDAAMEESPAVVAELQAEAAPETAPTAEDEPQVEEEQYVLQSTEENIIPERFTTPEPLESFPLPRPEEEEEPEVEEEEMYDEEEEEDEDGRAWYVIHCYSGYENKVRHNLEQRIESMNMKDFIFDVVVPTEEEIEVKDGKRRSVERRVFPGYILVNMIMTEESWYVVRNTPGVTSFVGMGNEPIPLRKDEVSSIVKRMEADAPRIKVTFRQGERVRIIDGPFNDFRGTVDEIDMERAKVRVMVNFFGRETPVELDFLQVEKA